MFPFDNKIIRKMANDILEACCDVCFTFNVDSKDFCSCVQLLRKKIITPLQSPQVCLGPATRSSMHACVTLIVWPKCPWKVFMMALNEQPLFHFITSKVSTVTNLGRCSTSWASVSKSLWRCTQIWSLKKGKSTGFPLNHVSCIPLSIWAFHIAATGSHGVWSPQVTLCDCWTLGTLKDWGYFMLSRVLGTLDSIPEKEDWLSFHAVLRLQNSDTGVIDFPVQGFSRF